MRPVIVQVPKGKGKAVLEKAGQYEGKNVSLQSGANLEKELDVVTAYISNRKVEGFISELDKMQDVQITLFPQGVMAMYPPSDQTADQVTHVENRSPIEIFLAGLQSKGTWKGFISYALLGSIVVWIGLYTSTTFLLVAAMLIAPFAGPAMNTAIATARGDWKLLRQGMLRYFVALLVTIAVACALSLLFGLETASPLMVERSQISSVAILLALAAGAAGALNLVQSERDSLVSGAAVGMLVAASLAPPTGVLGMAIALGRWDMVNSGLFVLILQLVGINLAGSLIFKYYGGLTSKGPRYKRGKENIYWVSLAVTVLMLGALVYWQFYKTPNLQRSSLSQRAVSIIQNVVQDNPAAELVEANARFTRASIPGQNTLLCVVYVQQKSGSEPSPEAIKKSLTDAIKRQINQKDLNVTPLVEVVVLNP